jgi:hypothetical protein
MTKKEQIAGLKKYWNKLLIGKQITGIGWAIRKGTIGIGHIKLSDDTLVYVSDPGELYTKEETEELL